MCAGREVAPQAASRSRRFADPPSRPRYDPPGAQARLARNGAAIAALAETPFALQFFSWAGLSGRTYVFTVYSPSDCPAFRNAVLLVAARNGAGARRALSTFDTGAFPECVVAEAAREFGAHRADLEFHLHLLPSGAGERSAVLADLDIGAA